MNILVTGAKGTIGLELVKRLKEIKEGINKSRPNIKIDDIFEYDKGDEKDLDLYSSKADFIFNLVGVFKPTNKEEYYNSNYLFTKTLIESLKKHNNKSPIMYASTIQASLIHWYDNDYGRSKKMGEDLLFSYSIEFNTKVSIYRLPNVMSKAKPFSNSTLSTICYTVANDIEYEIKDRDLKKEYLYIDDFIEGMFDLLENKEKRCDYDGLNLIDDINGKYSYIPNTYKKSYNEIINLLNDFKNNSHININNDKFKKKLYSLYLYYSKIY